MPKEHAAVTQLASLIKKLQADRQEHLDAIAQIDATFEQFGITPAAKKRRGKRREGARAARAGRKTAKVARKKKAGRKARRQFATTGNESILGFVKSAGKKGVAGAEIAKHWKSEGRGAGFYVALGRLVKEKKLKREKIKGAKGSMYRVA